jgi:hypothetical protein
MPGSMADFASMGCLLENCSTSKVGAGFVYMDNPYVCGNDAAGKIFKSEIKSNIAKADANWSKLIESQSHKR